METTGITRRQFACGVAMAAVGARAALEAVAAEPRPAGMKFTILGDSTCIPDPGHDVASFLINGKHLVDTGWYSALKMREYGFDPLALESIIITHFHQDHYLGLPQLLFFAGLKRKKDPLTIAGPAEYLDQVLHAAKEFLQISRFPEITPNYKTIPLKPGDTFELSDVRFQTMAAKHISGAKRSEPAIVFKVTDKTNGACAVFTGDTSYHPPIADFAQGVPLLIHDGAHTPAKDAADIAKRASVGRLVLIHHNQAHADRLLQEAKAVFPNTELAKEGQTLEIPALR
jgi:ribonuclease Z